MEAVMTTTLGLRISRDGIDLIDFQRYVETDRHVIRIGTSTTSDLRLEGDGVARMHALLEIAERVGHVRIHDLGGKAGTIVNGQRISAIDLSDGDVIVIGPHRLDITIRHVDDDKEPAS
jgi:pSer/pThr/pTyr-binding forkhead associated (FHA) protein